MDSVNGAKYLTKIEFKSVLGYRVTGKRASNKVRLKPTHVIEEGRFYQALSESIPLAIRKTTPCF